MTNPPLPSPGHYYASLGFDTITLYPTRRGSDEVWCGRIARDLITRVGEIGNHPTGNHKNENFHVCEDGSLIALGRKEVVVLVPPPQKVAETV